MESGTNNKVQRLASLALVGLFGATLVFLGGGLLENMVGAATVTETAEQAFDPEARLAELGIELYQPPPPVANYVKAVQTGKLVFLAGHGPTKLDGSGYLTGQVGTDLTIEEGYAAARLVGIALLSSLKAEIGDLSRVKRIVRVFGMVNAPAGFTQQPEVINGASDLFVAVFGERGKHARAAVGMASLPRNIAVEIEMVVELE